LFKEVVEDNRWRMDVDEKIKAIQKNRTWELMTSKRDKGSWSKVDLQS